MQMGYPDGPRSVLYRDSSMFQVSPLSVGSGPVIRRCFKPRIGMTSRIIGGASGEVYAVLMPNVPLDRRSSRGLVSVSKAQPGVITTRAPPTRELTHQAIKIIGENLHMTPSQGRWLDSYA